MIAANGSLQGKLILYQNPSGEGNNYALVASANDTADEYIAYECKETWSSELREQLFQTIIAQEMEESIVVRSLEKKWQYLSSRAIVESETRSAVDINTRTSELKAALQCMEDVHTKDLHQVSNDLGIDNGESAVRRLLQYLYTKGTTQFTVDTSVKALLQNLMDNEDTRNELFIFARDFRKQSREYKGDCGLLSHSSISASLCIYLEAFFEYQVASIAEFSEKVKGGLTDEFLDRVDAHAIEVDACARALNASKLKLSALLKAKDAVKCLRDRNSHLLVRTNNVLRLPQRSIVNVLHSENGDVVQSSESDRFLICEDGICTITTPSPNILRSGKDEKSVDFLLHTSREAQGSIPLGSENNSGVKLQCSEGITTRIPQPVLQDLKRIKATLALSMEAQLDLASKFQDLDEQHTALVCHCQGYQQTIDQLREEIRLLRSTARTMRVELLLSKAVVSVLREESNSLQNSARDH